MCKRRYFLNDRCEVNEIDQIRGPEISFMALALKVLKAYLYLRRFEFHIVSIVIEYPLYHGNIIHCPCGSSDSLSERE